ncbi:IS30 family transposase [Candidatus Poriferisocius sp.]|uniref:IS30 family transposase n=1 Tax=Candidatus Poriferisocius sp. TaxID=3101276 RepID=UPI003B5CBFBE
MARRLCVAERVRIEVLSGQGLGDGEIAGRLGRDRSTVWRERRRCGSGTYRALRAEADARARAARPRVSKLAGDGALCGRVQQRLDERLSPHAVSAELRSEGFRVCAETIYRACYRDSPAGGLKPGTWAKLGCARRRRKPRGRAEQAKRPVLGDYKPIAERPAAVEDRRVPGHWEGDLVIGKNNRTAIATLVEPTSRHTLVVGLAKPIGHLRPPQHHAPQTPPLALSPNHLHSTLSRPPIEPAMASSPSPSTPLGLFLARIVDGR